MDPAQALTELRQLSTQVEAAAVLDAEGGILAASPEAAGANLAEAGAELAAAARELGGREDVTRVEVELAEGAVFVDSEGGRTVVARTGPEPSAGLVVYDLRTCLRSLAQEEDAPAPKQNRARRSKGAASDEGGE